MSVVSREDLKTLVDARGPCVSIFLPAHRAGPDSRTYAQEDLIRFKNLLREADHRLTAGGLRSREAEELLDPARGLLRDPEFWQYQSDGLAVFVGPGVFRTYRVPHRVPELAVVTDRFHVKPLLVLLTGDGLFYILALSQNAVRLFEATREGASEVDLGNTPRSLKEALKYDDPERQLQFHTKTPALGGKRAAIFHGHGTGRDDAKTNVLRYLQQVNRGVAGLLRGASAPVVVAAAEPVLSIYREANTYPGLLDGTVPGNPDGLSAAELHARVWPLVAPFFHRAREAAIARYRELTGTGKATEDLREAVSAAAHGRVDCLFVPVGVQRWGIYDRATDAVDVHDAHQPGDEDLLNVAAVDTILNRGTVYAVEPASMPAEGPIAAVLRY